MKIRFLITVILLVLAITGCEKYDDYIKDYKYSAVYFATQKPLRTVVAYDEMEFKEECVVQKKDLLFSSAPAIRVRKSHRASIGLLNNMKQNIDKLPNLSKLVVVQNME